MEYELKQERRSNDLRNLAKPNNGSDQPPVLPQPPHSIPTSNLLPDTTVPPPSNPLPGMSAPTPIPMGNPHPNNHGQPPMNHPGYIPPYFPPPQTPLPTQQPLYFPPPSHYPPPQNPYFFPPPQTNHNPYLEMILASQQRTLQSVTSELAQLRWMVCTKQYQQQRPNRNRAHQYHRTEYHSSQYPQNTNIKQPVHPHAALSQSTNAHTNHPSHLSTHQAKADDTVPTEEHDNQGEDDGVNTVSDSLLIQTPPIASNSRELVQPTPSPKHQASNHFLDRGPTNLLQT